MNLSRVLDVALPDLPKLPAEGRLFRFNPNITWREQTEKGVTHFMAVAPDTRKVFMFTPPKWALVKLFNGVRTYDQIATLWYQQTGLRAPAADIRTFAQTLDEGGFWLRTAEEEALVIMETLKARKKQIKKRSVRDFTTIIVFTMDIDNHLSKVLPYVKFIYTPAFVISSVIALLAMVGLWFARGDEVWRDSIAYWNMTGKTGWDIAEFYLIFVVVGFFHESGHALSAKNVGAEVHRVGLMLVYTLPGFFVETTEVAVHGSYFQRMYVILAGFWYELILCAFATFIWWGTAVGGAVHNIAYKFILVGGIMPVLFNMNPLMRLDGYLFFSKLVRMPFLKEHSTAFLSAWVQNRIFRLPITIPPLRPRRAIFYAVFAFLSGAYTYSVLLFLARLTYKFAQNINPDWAFLPATLVAVNIFRSRIEKFAAFVAAVYKQHKDTVMAHRRYAAAAGLSALLFLFLPLWRESIVAPVALEPIRSAILNAHVAAQVDDVTVTEGQAVAAGTPIATLRGPEIDRQSDEATTGLAKATASATQAALTYAEYGTAEAERKQWSEAVRVATDKHRMLSIVSPISGVVVSPRMAELRGAYLTEGTKIAQIDDTSIMRARIFVDDSDMRSLRNITDNSIMLNSRFAPVHGTVEAISPAALEIEPGLVDATKYKGLRPPPHYVVSVLVNNDGTLRSGMTGSAKIFGRRESLIRKLWRPVADFVGRKIW